MSAPLPTYERVMEALAYDPETGILRNRIARHKSPAGRVLGTPNSKGYLTFRFDGGHYLVHRVAFFMMTGEWPKKLIDHEDRDRANNRWSNIRPATYGQNKANSTPGKNNILGVKGVSRRPGGRFVSRIRHDKRECYLGTFDTRALAAAAYADAAALLHGQFARIH